MQGYYSHLEHLRGRLLAGGHDKWAIGLLAAERSSSTSGEALSNTGVVLRRLLDSDEPSLSDFRDEARIVCVGVELIELTVKDRAAWRRWLEKNHGASPGVWLTLAKKAKPGPTTLTYDEALEESLCFGWIDGQRGAGDGTTARQRFTHRGPRSRWSARNVGIVERLQAQGRMEPEGEAEVARAQADGRWTGAYTGPAKSVVPADLAAALRANPAAQAMFEILTSQNRYAIHYRVEAARRPETRAANIEKFVAMLARGETVHPQKRQLTD